MGHTAWFDREVLGGQAWWSTILRQIRECDLYVLILTPRSLESQACRAEYTYAAQVNRSVLPVLCKDGVKVSLLPPELSVIQFVDYRAQDKQAAFALMRAVQEAPAPLLLPDPLPPEPPVPVSYLGDLRRQIEVDLELTLTAQRDLLFEIKRRLKDPESGADAWDLLKLLRTRQDLLASVAEEVDALLERKPARRPQRKPQVKRETGPAAPAPVNVKVKRENGELAATRAQKTINLTEDTGALEGLVARVGANQDKSWVIKAGSDTVRVFAENKRLVVEATYSRWGEKEAKVLKAMGWTPGGQGMQAAALLGITLLGSATSGLGFGLLANKKTRDFLNKNQARKEFPPAKTAEAAASILECLRVLCPDLKEAVVSQERPPT